MKEIFRPSYREIVDTKASKKLINTKLNKKDTEADDDTIGSGFGANVQTLKRDIVHLKRLFPRKYTLEF